MTGYQLEGRGGDEEVTETRSRVFINFWKSYVFFLTPILLLPLPLVVMSTYDSEINCNCSVPQQFLNVSSITSEAVTAHSIDVTHPYLLMAKTGYVLALMAVFWITDCIPLAVTALLPTVLMPIMGLVRASVVSPLYLKDVSMMGAGGFIVANSIERWGLHKRIALRVLTLFGTKPRWLLLGFMFPAWFLSMWISNTATTAMMIPIVEAVLTQMRGHKSQVLRRATMSGQPNEGFSPDDQHESIGKPNELENGNGHPIELADIHTRRKSAQECSDSDELEEKKKAEDKKFNVFARCLSLSVAYAATTGGISTLTGTAPNLIMRDTADDLFRQYGGDDAGVSFPSWMSFGLPTSAVMLVLVWLWLQIWFLGFRELFSCSKRPEEKVIETVLKEEYQKLGPITFAEGAVLGHFIVLALGWLTRSPGFVDGWAMLMPKGFTSDSTSAMLVASSLFFFPSEAPRWFGCKKDHPRKPVRALMTWEEAQTGMPWGVIILIGGGFALAEASKISGLSLWFGQKLSVLGSLDPIVMMLILVIFTAGLTEVTSNTAVSSILMPIFGNMAIELGKNPLYLMFPTALACSFAFMLPVATPPNAVVFSYGRVKVIDMIKAGFALNIIGVLAVTMATNTWGMALFNFNEFPEIFKQSANTTVAETDLCAKYVYDLPGKCWD